ncbi:hypothetical protein [Campylobacter sp. 19-13652]|nr:hypothetical protein [Campylobacter sp. 19-13652]
MKKRTTSAEYFKRQGKECAKRYYKLGLADACTELADVFMAGWSLI